MTFYDQKSGRIAENERRDECKDVMHAAQGLRDNRRDRILAAFAEMEQQRDDLLAVCKKHVEAERAANDEANFVLLVDATDMAKVAITAVEREN